MNTVAPLERPTKLDTYLAEVLPPEKKEALFKGLPRHIRPELFERNLANAIMQQPDLLKCDPREVYREVAQIAALGLMLDPQLGEAWLIVAWSAKAGRHSPQRRVGYRGLIKLARQSGEVSTIYAREVHEKDDFNADLYANEISHTADLFGERGAVIGYYAVVRYRDGGEDFEPMSVAEAERLRDRYSDGYKAWKAGKTNRLPIWETDFSEMAKKSVLRRLIKRVPQSPELAEALKADYEREGNDQEAATEEPLRRPRGRPRLTEALTRIAQPQSPQSDPPQPRQPEPEPKPEPEPEPEEDDPDLREPEDGMGYDTREEKRMDREPPFDEPPKDTGRRDDEEGSPRMEAHDERARLYAAGLAAANQGSRKFKFWLAKQMPAQLAKLTPEDMKQLAAIATEAADA